MPDDATTTVYLDDRQNFASPDRASWAVETVYDAEGHVTRESWFQIMRPLRKRRPIRRSEDHGR